MAAMVIVFLTGCKKLDLIPEDQFTDETYWTSEGKARSVLNTAYSQMSNSARFFFNEGLSDNAVMGRGDAQGAASISRGTFDPSLSRFKEEWSDSYAGIKTTNIFLENVDRVPDMNEDTRNRMKAEARFIRAFKHFQLMTWFGDVPLVSQDLSLQEARTISRTPRAQVLAFILSELDAAAADLPANTELSTNERGMLTKGAALGLKARVLLYEGEWQQVVETCEMLMHGSNGNYALFSSYEGLFHPDNQYSSEDILSLQYVPELRTWGEYFDLAPISVGSRLNAMAPTQELVDSYLMTNGRTIDESGSGYNEDNPYVNRDPRLTATVVYHLYRWDADSGTPRTIYTRPGTAPDATGRLDEYSPGSSASPTGYYWRKYYDPEHSSNMASGLNLMLIRYADILLMYAEAKNELSQLDEGVWNQTIRPLRERAGFTDAGALTYPAAAGQTGLRDIVRNERRVELALEGLRIFDIRRWRIADEVLNGWVHGARFGSPSEDGGYIRVVQRSFDESKHYLWPVPRDERNINQNLSQNPGWN